MRARVTTAEFVRAAHDETSFLRDDHPEVAFVGRSNVGKSSLLNALVGRKGLARVSQTPGRTQAVNYFDIDGRLRFVDLPGYGFAKISATQRRQFAALTERYLEARSGAPRFALVLLVDGQIGPTELDDQARAWLSELGVEPVVVATKIDRVSKNRRRATLAGIAERLSLQPDNPPLAVSSRTGEGIPDLWKVIGARTTHAPGA